MAELRLDLFALATPRGTVLHLVSDEDTTARTLCGRAHGINPRYVRLGAQFLLAPERATCAKCITLGTGPDPD